MAWSAEDVVFGGRESFGGRMPAHGPPLHPLDLGGALARPRRSVGPGDVPGRGRVRRCRDPHLERATLAVSTLAPPVVRGRAHRAGRVRAAQPGPPAPAAALVTAPCLPPGARLPHRAARRCRGRAHLAVGHRPARALWLARRRTDRWGAHRSVPGTHRPGLVGQALRRGSGTGQRRDAGRSAPRDRLGPWLRAGASIWFIRRLRRPADQPASRSPWSRPPRRTTTWPRPRPTARHACSRSVRGWPGGCAWGCHDASEPEWGTVRSDRSSGPSGPSRMSDGSPMLPRHQHRREEEVEARWWT
jgi:hypothetical protein